MRLIGTLLLLSGAGCTHLLQPTVRLSPHGEGPLSMRAALVMEDDLADRVDEYGRFSTLGAAHKWNLATGSGVKPALENLARDVFSDVMLVESAPEARGAELTVVPEVESMRHIEERDGFWFEFRLRVRVLQASGAVVLDRSYRGEAEGSGAAAFFGGVGAAAPALLVPSEEAMRQALEELRRDLRRLAASRAASAVGPLPSPAAPAQRQAGPFDPARLQPVSFQSPEARALAEGGPSRGGSIAMIVTGSVLLGAAALSGLGAVPFWLDGLDVESGPGSGFSSDDARDTLIGGALSAVALASLITGAILLPVGARRLRSASAGSLEVNDAQASLLHDVRPFAALSATGGLLGLSAAF